MCLNKHETQPLMNKAKKENEEKDFDVEEIIFHETFNEGPYLNNDIAIIKIKTLNRGGMDFGRHVQPVCYSAPSHDSNFLLFLEFAGCHISAPSYRRYPVKRTRSKTSLENSQKSKWHSRTTSSNCLL